MNDAGHAELICILLTVVLQSLALGNPFVLPEAAYDNATKADHKFSLSVTATRFQNVLMNLALHLYFGEVGDGGAWGRGGGGGGGAGKLPLSVIKTVESGQD